MIKMKYTDIYQTLEDRQNYRDVEKNGPFFCSERETDGTLKKGTKVPWLGEGYYFWDSRIEDAKWWGNIVYERKGYIICHTEYDQHSPLLYDMVGDVKKFDEFIECANFIKEKRRTNRIAFPVVLKYLKEKCSFNYKAIRVWPCPQHIKKTCVVFSKGEIILGIFDRIQICFFDKTLLTKPYRIINKQSFTEEQTI